MRFAAWLLLVFPAWAQGISPEWDMRSVLDSIQKETQRLKPVFDQVHPENWGAKGAPAAYVAQWNAAQDQSRYLVSAAEALSQQPERMTIALEIYFRMETLQTTLSSLVEGIRKYQDPGLAGDVQKLLNVNHDNRAKLRQYVTDLAAQKEQEFQIADREAQRCRGTLTRLPSGPAHRK